MENFENNLPEQPQQDSQFANIVPALIQFFTTIGYFLFAVPFALWMRAVNNLAAQRKTGSLRIGTIKSPWPLFTFLKRLCIEFGCDAMAFIMYPLGIIAAIVVMISDSFGSGIIVLVASYYSPIIFAGARDTMILMLLPIRKLLDFFRRPAQTLDVFHAKLDKED